MTQEMTPDAYDEAAEMQQRQRRVGQRLRAIRRQQALSLADVESRSGGVWKAVVVGAYERGDRAVTVERLARLAEFYGVPLVDLLPGPRRREDGAEPPRVIIDLTRTRAVVDNDAVDAVRRFADRVQRVRGDHNGRMLTLRGADLDVIALAIGSVRDELIMELDRHGALLPA